MRKKMGEVLIVIMICTKWEVTLCRLGKVGGEILKALVEF